jgi:transcriptional regulator with XRE-family HTH domain
MEPYIKYPRSMATLGDHIRKRRLDLKLTAREAARRLGVGMCTIYSWEYHRTGPSPRRLAEIVAFLGYEPDGAIRRFCGERILAYRKAHGISRRQLALILGIHRTTLRQWEKNERCPSQEFLEKVTFILDVAPLKGTEGD